MKKPKLCPEITFVRAQYIAKSAAQNSHRELSHLGKQLKRFFVTTGMCITYLNDFEAHIYNIQRPSKENVPTDHTYDYFMRVVMARKLAIKKASQVQKSVTIQSFIASVTGKNAPGGEPAKPPMDEKIKNLTLEQSESMRKNLTKPARVFKMPY